MRVINYVVLHCSATRPDQDIGADEIRDWHKKRGFIDIGYHFVIRLNGALELGRPITMHGAHVKGHNHDSVGVCYVGGYDEDGKAADTRTDAQKTVMANLVHDMLTQYPGAKVIGHRDFPDVNKACPCFDAAAWWRDVEPSLKAR